MRPFHATILRIARQPYWTCTASRQGWRTVCRLWTWGAAVVSHAAPDGEFSKVKITGVSDSMSQKKYIPAPGKGLGSERRQHHDRKIRK
mmetsp:Transcript_41797/g.97874  ORF Transcript_41797/g.97874 Transcript_41797/m.97874 type:complete len:89 (-) Transcript_41797:1794-2060(-)